MGTMPIQMYRVDYFKKLRAVIGLLVLLCFSGLIIFFLYNRALIPLNKQKDISHSQPQSTRLEIRGFQYNRSVNNKKVLSIKANRFAIEKKKLGFFRFNLMNVAKFEKALIQLYGRERVPENVPGEFSDNTKKVLSFKDTLSKSTLPSFPIKRIYSIVIEPIKLELYDEKSVVSSISATSASLRLRKRIIIFEGNVKAVSGEKVLTATRLILLPDEAVFKIGGHFLLKTPLREWEGYRLTTDIFLKPIT